MDLKSEFRSLVRILSWLGARSDKPNWVVDLCIDFSFPPLRRETYFNPAGMSASVQVDFSKDDELPERHSVQIIVTNVIRCYELLADDTFQCFVEATLPPEVLQQAVDPLSTTMAAQMRSERAQKAMGAHLVSDEEFEDVIQLLKRIFQKFQDERKTS